MRTLAARGYQEVVTFGFVDPALQRVVVFTAPVGSNRARSSCQSDRRRPGGHAQLAAAGADRAWHAEPTAPAAARAGVRDRNRFVCNRVRAVGGGTRTEDAGRTAVGRALPEQWGSASTPVDFYDAKGDLSALLALGGDWRGLFSSRPLPGICIPDAGRA